MIVTVPKIGTGSQDDPIRPDMTAKHWQMVEEGETEFVIEIIDN